MKADIGLIFKYILAIIIPLIVYFGIGWINKDIYFSIWEIVDSTTLEEIYNKEILVYACVAVGYIILCHIILDDNSPVGGMVFAGAFPVVGYILCVYVLPISEGAAILYYLVYCWGYNGLFSLYKRIAYVDLGHYYSNYHWCYLGSFDF